MQCDAIMDIYGDHFVHCERGIHRIRRHEAQVRLLEADLIKAERHPVVEPRPFGRHKERPDISALGSHSGSDIFDIKFCHPLSRPRVRDGVDNAMNLVQTACDKKIKRFGRFLHESIAFVKLFPMHQSTPGDWYPDSHRAMRSIAINIAPRTLNSLEYVGQALFESTTAARGLSTFSRAGSILF